MKLFLDRQRRLYLSSVSSILAGIQLSSRNSPMTMQDFNEKHHEISRPNENCQSSSGAKVTHRPSGPRIDRVRQDLFQIGNQTESIWWLSQQDLVAIDLSFEYFRPNNPGFWRQRAWYGHKLLVVQQKRGKTLHPSQIEHMPTPHVIERHVTSVRSFDRYFGELSFYSMLLLSSDSQLQSVFKSRTVSGSPSQHGGP